MKKEPLYKDKKFTSWTVNRIAETLCAEWSALDPELEKNVIVYERKVTLIAFKGEVSVSLEITKQRFPDKDLIQMYFGLSLSPIPYDLKTHVLNTLDMALLIELFPELNNKHFFTIGKAEPWNGSLFSRTTQAMQSVIETMLNFESCFHLLLDDEYEIDGTKLDSKKLSLTHHLNQVKAYRLAGIYNHPEKLDEAIKAIKKYAEKDELSKRRIAQLCETKSAGGMNWLYTPELIERLCK